MPYYRYSLDHLLFMLLLLSSSAAQNFPDQGSRPRYTDEVHIRLFDVKIPVRDGASLDADIWLPQRSGTFPTIYVHTPYGRKTVSEPFLDSPFLQELTARNDYVYVATDWRRQKDSQLPRAKPGLDAYDSIEWIAQQPWSNGKIGMWGQSAPGVVEYDTIREKPPHLVCAVPASATFGTQYAVYYENGAFQERHALILRLLGYPGHDFLTAHPGYDFAWRFLEGKAAPRRIDLPLLLITGWYDSHADQKIAMLDRLQSMWKRHSDDMKLIIGPWHHTAFGQAAQAGLEFPEAAGYAGRETVRFFDFWLRNAKNGWEETPRIRYFEMGGNMWKSAEDWPPRSGAKEFFLRPEGALSDLPGHGRAVTRYRLDPKDPSPTVGGRNVQLRAAGDAAGPHDISLKIEGRKDAAIFTTGALSQALPISGAVEVKLFVSSDAEDADIAARLTDVYPDGRSILLLDGIQRMGYLRSNRRPNPIVPGRVYEVSFSLGQISHSFRPGHRIRLVITGANYPKFDINPVALKSGAVQTTIYHDANRPSRLVLPVARDS